MASSPAVLKQQAAALELKKQPEKALALYQQLLSEHGGTDDVDVALRNRVGDLHLRVGQIDDAITLFERSADEYALSGFLNNAIALCNKILRQRPGHVPTLRRLARFSAEKGMVVDAQRHYLSVAELLEKLGQHGEALKALSEFAELSPEDVHVRSVVVEQLLRAGRKPDALPHLTVLHRLHAVAGRADEAEGVAQVAREIDGAWVPESEQVKEKRTDLSLILLDSDDDFGLLETSPMPGSASERPAAVPSLEGLEPTAAATSDMDEAPTGATLDGFEATSFESPEPPVDRQAVPPAAAVEPIGLPEGSMPADTLEFLEVENSPTVDDELSVPQTGSALELDDPFGVAAVPSRAEDAPAETDDTFTALEMVTDPGAAAPLPILDGDELLLGMPTAETAVPLPAPQAGNSASNVPVASTELTTPSVHPPAAPAAAPAQVAHRAQRPTPSFVNLADLLRDDEPTSPRMTIGEPKQTGNEEADFQHILSEFRDGIEKSIAIDDADSHFDLGIAFREMGLVDDAIAEFQIAARSQLRRIESIEALGGCFLDKGEPSVARTLLLRALDEPAVAVGDDTLRGVLYLLGLASEAIGARDDGLRYYQRVYAVDIRFRDVAARIQTLQQPA